MIIKLSNLGSIGIIKDTPAYELPPEAFSDGENVRFTGEWAERFPGHEEVYNLTVSAATATQAPAESPWFVMPAQSATNYWWLYAGKNSVHVATNSSNGTNINKLDSTASATLLYSSTPSIKWSGINLGGLVYLNNGVNTPQVWTSVALATRLQDIQWDISASGTTSASGGGPVSWANRSAGAMTCQKLCAYREYILALNTTENSVQYQRRVRWSHPAVAGAQPTTWVKRPGSDAGFKDIDETRDFLIDGKVLRDSFILYKESSTWLMRWVEGQYVFSFRQLFPTWGIIAPDCVQEVEGRHVVWTDSDIIVHNGASFESIITKKWRRYLFNSIDDDYRNNCFTTLDTENEQVFFWFHTTGAPEAFWPNEALVWNYRYNTWSHREGPKIAYAQEGLIPFGSGANTFTWDLDSGTWDSDIYAWNAKSYNTGQRGILAASPEDSASTTPIPRLLRLNATQQFAGSGYTSRVERQSLAISWQDRMGNLKINLQNYKLVHALWPYIDAPTGAVFSISVGSQKNVNDAVNWAGPYTYTVGTDRKINCRVMGRLISFRIESTEAKNWKLTQIDLDIDLVGHF